MGQAYSGRKRIKMSKLSSSQKLITGIYLLWWRIWHRIHRYSYCLGKRFKARSGIGRDIDKVGQTRTSWEKTFLALWEPIFDKFSEGKALVKIDGPQMSIGGGRSDGYEGFARTFIGAAFYLHHKEESTVTLSNSVEIDIAAIYREGIVNGTNPRHREYWGKIRSPQRVVENCSVAAGLLLTRKHIWNKLSPQEKDSVARWFKNDLSNYFPLNNWQWFKVFHHVFLEQTGYETDDQDLEQTLENIEKMYVNHGWYSDGVGAQGHYDYYVAWAMHYYSLLFSYLSQEKHQKRKMNYLKRAREFLNSYQFFFTPGNHPPLYGRSQTYRWASLAPWGMALLLGGCDVDLNWIKTSSIDTINTFLEKGAIREDGILNLGYYDEFTPMLEPYSGPASPYWAFKAFSFLLLPEDHPFWATPTETAKPKKMVSSIPTAKMVLLHSGDSQVTMLTTASSAVYPIKYNKFAYSNSFPMNYNGKNPVDNMLLLRSWKSKWSCRNSVLESSCQQNVCESKWQAGNITNATIKTTLIGRTDGYIAVHQLCKGPSLAFKTGGFPITGRSKDTQKQMKQDEVVLKSREGEVGIRLVYGQVRPAILSKSGVNPAGKSSLVPYFKGKFGRVGEVLVLAVWANRNKKPMELPLVKVDNKKCQITWPGEEPIYISRHPQG